MKRDIFQYLFIISLGIIVFQLFKSYNTKKNFNYEKEALQTENIMLTDSVGVLQSKVMDLDYFNLVGNDNAMSYYERLGYEARDIERTVTGQLYDQNTAGDGHPLVPYEGMEENPMRINKIKFLNHRWIIADFTDGKYWGEMLVRFDMEQDGEIKLNVVESFLYPPE